VSGRSRSSRHAKKVPSKREFASGQSRVLFRFSLESSYVANLGCLISVADAKVVVEYGYDLVDLFRQSGTSYDEKKAPVFGKFHQALYGAGFVPGDFDGSTFDRGPMKLFLDPELAAILITKANLVTLQMVTHTLARSHRWGTMDGRDFNTFDEAFKSGLLEGLLERLDAFLGTAESNRLTEFSDDILSRIHTRAKSERGQE